MRILLPPSETKRDGTMPGTLEIPALVAPGLTADRLRAIQVLAKYCARQTPAVRAAIGTTANQDAELVRNGALLTAPIAPAHEIYDGVLFDAIGLPSLTAAHRRRTLDACLVQSALFGVVGFGDLIPAYRCSSDSTLPRLGRMATYWRSRLPRAMPALLDGHLVVDMRSGGYASMWQPDATLAARFVAIKVMEMRGGRRLAVSHFNKATKGALVAVLSAERQAPHTVEDAARVVAEAGYEVTLTPAKTGVTLEVMMRSA